MVKQGVKNPALVLEGIYNSVKMEFDFLSEEEVNVIVLRRLICQSCPFMSENTGTNPEYKKVYGKDYSTSRKDPHCSICSCPIKTKTAALNANCGLEELNNEKYPIKWAKYKHDEENK